MPYSTRYLLNQLARGRPTPTGNPESQLFRAIRVLSPMDIEAALMAGASAHARDHHGIPAIHQLLENPLVASTHPDRIMACARALLRHGRVGLDRHPRSGQSALAAAAMLAGGAHSLSWYHLWERAGDWATPDGRGQSALEAWQNMASPELASRLPAARGRKPSP